MVQKVVIGIAICVIIFMLKSTYQTRMILAVGLIGAMAYWALSKKR